MPLFITQTGWIHRYNTPLSIYSESLLYPIILLSYKTFIAPTLELDHTIKLLAEYSRQPLRVKRERILTPLELLKIFKQESHQKPSEAQETNGTDQVISTPRTETKVISRDDSESEEKDQNKAVS